MPLQAPFIALMARAAGSALALLEHPPMITGLASRGSAILIFSYLGGQQEAIASWSGRDLHLFVVASLALILAVPVGNLKLKTRLIIWSATFIMLLTFGISVVQLKTVADASASSNLGFALYSAAERAFLGMANKALIMVGMVLLPSFLFLTAYAASWSEARVATLAQRPTRSRQPPQRSWWQSWGTPPLVALAAGALLLLVPPSSDPTPAVRAEGLRRILELNPSSARAWFSQGQYDVRDGKFREALEMYRAALRLDPDLVLAHFGAGNVYFAQREYDLAIKSYDEVLKRDPEHILARYNLGNAFIEKGELEPAARSYEAVLSRDPNQADAHKNLGIVLERLERPCDALAHLKRSSALDRRYFGDPAVRSEIVRLTTLCPGK